MGSALNCCGECIGWCKAWIPCCGCLCCCCEDPYIKIPQGSKGLLAKYSFIDEDFKNIRKLVVLGFTMLTLFLNL